MFFTQPLRMSKPQAGADRPRSWYEIKGATEEVAEVRIYDSIGYWGITAGDFAAELEAIKAKAITLRINSAGGDVFDGMAIYNLLRDHPATVTTRVDGLAGSIASIVALAGDTVTIPKTAYMMIHQPWAFTIGNASDMRAMADVLDKVAGPMVEIYAEKTGKTEAEVIELLDAETWLTGAEAVEAGFADELLRTTSDATEDDDDDDATEAAAAALDPSIFVNPPPELAGDSTPAADAIELQRRRLRLMELE